MAAWTGRWLTAAGLLLGVVGAVVVAGDELADIKRHRVVELAPYPLVLPTDANSLTRGAFLYATRGCVECHGADGAGRRFLDDGKGFVLAAPGIAPGPGSATARYAPADWERTVRHGVKPDGRPVQVMPSERYNAMSDDDVAAVAAYVASMPPRRARAAAVELPLRLRVLYGFGRIDDAAALIDHRLRPGEARPLAANEPEAEDGWRLVPRRASLL